MPMMRMRVWVSILLARDKGGANHPDEETHDGETGGISDSNRSDQDHDAAPYHEHALEHPRTKLCTEV